jgi:hypothetical protein
MAVRLEAVNPLRCRIAGAATSSSCVQNGSRTILVPLRMVVGQRMQVAHQMRSPLRAEVLCRLQKSVAARDERAHHAQLGRRSGGAGAWRKWRGTSGKPCESRKEQPRGRLAGHIRCPFQYNITLCETVAYPLHHSIDYFDSFGSCSRTVWLLRYASLSSPYLHNVCGTDCASL